MRSRIILRIILLLLVTLAVMASHCQTISGIINTYYKVTAINSATSTLTLTGTAGLTSGTRILIIQMKGAAIVSTNNSSFGNLSAINQAGNYEINTICGISGSDILLQKQLARTYDVTGLVQVVTIPQYNSVTVTDTLKAANWDPVAGTGGVLVLEATGTVTLNSVIDVSGAGFTGGTIGNYANCVWSTTVNDYALPAAPSDPNVNGAKKGEGIAAFITNNEYSRGKQANGGGGGNNHNTGGGGGANYGAGGQGGNRSNETFFACHGTTPGIGGLGLSSQGYSLANNRIFLGGGGGAGHENNSVATPGGNGGGIVIIKAGALAASGQKILANGTRGVNPLCSNPLMAEGDGGGGGGGGGVVLLDVANYTSPFTVEAKGADGSISGNATNNCTGPGGGGGGGVVWVSAGSFPVNVIATTAAGANGTISAVNSGGCGGQANGATSGVSGASLTSLVIPESSTIICSPLPAPNLLSFQAAENGGWVDLKWLITNSNNIGQIIPERSFDLQRFNSLTILDKSHRSFRDSVGVFSLLYYRLKIVNQDASIEYSRIISVRNKHSAVTPLLYPNPASQQIYINIEAGRKQTLIMSVLDVRGHNILLQSVNIDKGGQIISMPVQSLPKGVYILSYLLDGIPFRQKFTRL